MPPQVALLFTLSLIMISIYFDQKDSRGFSKTEWIIAIWILYSGSKGLGVFLNIQTTIEAGSPPDRFFQLFLGIIAIIIIAKRSFEYNSELKKNALIFIIYFYSLISVIWAKDPGISFRRWGKEVIALLMTFLLTSEKYPIRVMLGALKKAIYTALPISLLLIKYYPKYGRSYSRWTGEEMWEGIASQKNGLAMLCAISILFLIWSIGIKFKDYNKTRSKIPFIIEFFMIFLAAYLMIGPRRTLTYSATSFSALLFAIIIMIYIKVSIKNGIAIKKQLLILAIIIMFFGIFLPFKGEIPTKTLPKLLNRGDSLTGRTEIWQALVPYATQRIFIGYGFGGFWTTSLRSQLSSHAHNGYLDCILDLGIVGLLLFIIFVLRVLLKTLDHAGKNNYLSYFFIPLIFIIMIRNIAESPLNEFNDYLMWLFLSWSFLVNHETVGAYYMQVESKAEF